jgi:hypothetical protein
MQAGKATQVLDHECVSEAEATLKSLLDAWTRNAADVDPLSRRTCALSRPPANRQEVSTVGSHRARPP